MSEQQLGRKTVTLREMAETFHLERLTGDESTLDRVITEPDVNRPGFELCGYVRDTDPQRIIIIGNKETEYIGHMSEHLQYERFPNLMENRSPCIIVTRNNPVAQIMLDIARQKNFPIFRSTEDTGRLSVDLTTFLDEKLAIEETIYGVLVVVYGKGVLLTGESGIGKSETALELIRDGQTLVADDRVDILRVHSKLIGTAPKLLERMLELRGIGVIDVERMYGATSYVSRHQIDMVIHLTHMDNSPEYDRLGDHIRETSTILDVEVPTIALPVSPGRSTSVLVESAVVNFTLQEEGYNSSQIFQEQQRSYLRSQNELRKGQGKR